MDIPQPTGGLRIAGRPYHLAPMTRRLRSYAIAFIAGRP
ncbi:hypothetical protein MPS_0519 [Mycobacterium pseudoshottsii JCM 15466]|uniref:Uncharacterized protein n=1 Tax=Mycobacterium ulcerans str. Harvey TaxID=1299332 RepID=A0ABP3AKQ9_MYCUL|nr:hypothetical protein MMSP_2166 [Mycobacterium sp. 012931]EPQ75510.1 hypothetical protein MMMB2_0170 [Mycobacterium marinum MB2]EUA90421.1 hypothetical protein I551_3154 [Mycobacterium ulcerans str. Harvey]GAQ32139.1 hypothetical protein MPS_0519 [Mycobacterium pseudoshottsii JCM 15466]